MKRNEKIWIVGPFLTCPQIPSASVAFRRRAQTVQHLMRKSQVRVNSYFKFSIDRSKFRALPSANLALLAEDVVAKVHWPSIPSSRVRTLPTGPRESRGGARPPRSPIHPSQDQLRHRQPARQQLHLAHVVHRGCVAGRRPNGRSLLHGRFGKTTRAGQWKVSSGSEIFVSQNCLISSSGER